jgi:hypothetical protein
VRLPDLALLARAGVHAESCLCAATSFPSFFSRSSAAELRSYVSAYTEARTALTAAERRRDGNLLVRALDEVITPAALAAAQAEVVGPALSEYVQVRRRARRAASALTRAAADVTGKGRPSWKPGTLANVQRVAGRGVFARK